PVIEIETGKKIGEHKGYWFYTIGQRKGLGLGGGPWFVVRKNIRDNVVYVSRGYDTKLQYGKEIYMDEMHWITLNPFESDIMSKNDDGSIHVSFKTRHTPEFFDGELHLADDGRYLIKSERDVQGIAPGQYSIIYTPDRKICLGSGMIANR
ncbi:MAG: tRNA 2-thiouridine(34) synthase MnmA, partial [Muribaculaceae bacterium]|nr:tRNA 2-thiouridine(34) synthase MnmA [Muribaculaceae bacterium]